MDYSPKEICDEMTPNGSNGSTSNNNNNNNNKGEEAKDNGHNGSRHPSDGEESDHNLKVPSKQRKFNQIKQLKKSKYSAAQEKVRRNPPYF